VRQSRNEFFEHLNLRDVGNQVYRAARRFALIAAGGEFATHLGITGWQRGDAHWAAARNFAAWLERRGSTGPSEIEHGITQVRKYFEINGQSRFSPLVANPDIFSISNRAGFRETNDGVGTEYYVFPNVFRDELCAGYDSKMLAAELVKRSLLVSGKNKTSISKYIPALKEKKRMYHFSSRILEEGEED